jgi:hypothetical protein
MLNSNKITFLLAFQEQVVEAVLAAILLVFWQPDFHHQYHRPLYILDRLPSMFLFPNL